VIRVLALISVKEWRLEYLYLYACVDGGKYCLQF
jgi:hypothetical protein